MAKEKDGDRSRDNNGKIREVSKAKGGAIKKAESNRTHPIYGKVMFKTRVSSDRIVKSPVAMTLATIGSGDEAGKISMSSGIVLGNGSGKPESHMTALEKMEIVLDGVSKKTLEQLKKRTKLDYDKLAKILSVGRATLINKSKEEKFNRSLSEKIVGLADIYSYGYDVFEDENNFNEWMFRPNQALNGITPFDLMDNQYGREEVKAVIGRIDYGVYS